MNEHRHRPGENHAAYYARMSRMPLPELTSMALRELGQRRRWSKIAPVHGKPVVRVFTRAGKELLALRAGRWVVSAHTWAALTRKAALGPWRVFDRTVQLKKRWRT